MLPPEAYADYARSLKRPAPPSLPAGSHSRMGVRSFDDAFARTIWGTTFVGLEVGLTTAGFILGYLSGGPWGGLPSAGLFAGVGFVLFLSGSRYTESTHHRFVLAGLVLSVSAVAVYLVLPVALGVPFGVHSDPTPDAIRAYILTDTFVLPIGLAGMALASFGLQDWLGRFLLLSGIASAVLFQILLWWTLNVSLDAMVVQMAATHNWDLLWSFPDVWARLGRVNAVPAGLILVAYERLYWQLHRRHEAMRPPAPA